MSIIANAVTYVHLSIDTAHYVTMLLLRMHLDEAFKGLWELRTF